MKSHPRRHLQSYLLVHGNAGTFAAEVRRDLREDQSAAPDAANHHPTSPHAKDTARQTRRQLLVVARERFQMFNVANVAVSSKENEASGGAGARRPHGLRGVEAGRADGACPQAHGDPGRRPEDRLAIL